MWGMKALVGAMGASALLLGGGYAMEWRTEPATPAARVGPPAPAPAQATGKAIFEGKGNCATCHGKDAKGTPLAPDLTDGEWLNIGGSLEEIAAVVRTGVAKPKKHPAPMPPMGGGSLRPAEVEAVARYVLGLGPGAPR